MCSFTHVYKFIIWQSKLFLLSMFSPINLTYKPLVNIILAEINWFHSKVATKKNLFWCVIFLEDDQMWLWLKQSSLDVISVHSFAAKLLWVLFHEHELNCKQIPSSDLIKSINLPRISISIVCQIHLVYFTALHYVNTIFEEKIQLLLN